MPHKPPRSPQEKKALSYGRDCRNVYGENAKSSRKAIAARKAAESRRSRRKAGHMLKVIERVTEEVAATAESALRQNVERVGGWCKRADEPLERYLERKSRGRLRRGLPPNRQSPE